MLEVNELNFEDEVCQEVRLVMVDFFTTWCNPCRMLAPILEQLEKNNIGKLKIVKLDCDQNQNLTTNYSVSGLPTLLFFKNGEVINKLVGLQSLDTLQNTVNKLIAS